MAKLLSAIALSLAAVVIVPSLLLCAFFMYFLLVPALAQLGIPPWLPGACISDPVEKFHHIAGLEFEVVETNCDVIAKEEWRELHVRHVGKVTRTEIFRYAGLVVPKITAADRRTILISFERVSAIGLQLHQWRDWAIRYDIRSIEFPNRDRMRIDDR